MGYKPGKIYWCCQCLNVSSETQQNLNEHLKLCMNHEIVETVLPEKKIKLVGMLKEMIV